jgi:hypothetical protein
MWSKTGQWRPQDYSLHYTYSQIGDRPKEQEKINFINNLFNTILERSHSKGNFSDVRAELVDHYVSALGDDFYIESGSQFRQKVHGYRDTFGGHDRIIKIAKNYYKTKQRLVRWQFFKWFACNWMVHLAISPILFLIYLNIVPFHFIISQAALMFLVAIYEGIKLHRDRDIVKQSRSGDSSVSFFYQYKAELTSFIFAPIYFYNLGSEPTAADMSLYGLIIVFFYTQLWAYYYHLNVCHRLVAPLLQNYKSQLVYDGV